MDKFAEVILTVAKEGGATAQTLILWYYIYWSISALATSATFLGMTWIICRTVRWGINRTTRRME